MGRDDVCPRCKTHRSRRRDMIMYTFPCGHCLYVWGCDVCVNGAFKNLPYRICYDETCQQQIRNSEKSIKVFDSGTVHRDVLARTNVLSVFNFRECDFPALAAYNDYLEMVEDFAFELAQPMRPGQSLEAFTAHREGICAQVEKWRLEHEEQIQDNKDRERREAKERRARRIRETGDVEMARAARRARMQEEAAKKQRQLDQLYADMSDGARNANDLVKSFKAAERKRKLALENVLGSKQPQLVLRPAKQARFDDMAGAEEEEDEPFVYSRSVADSFGPPLMTPQLAQFPYGPAVPETCGIPMVGTGYSLDVTAKRALQEAFSGLFLSAGPMGGMDDAAD